MTDDSINYVKTLYGENARHVPAWLYVQDQGAGVVLLAGASHIKKNAAHPLRYGSTRAHQFILGEIIVRPHYVIGSDVAQGAGVAGLLTPGYTPADLLVNGEVILGHV